MTTIEWVTCFIVGTAFGAGLVFLLAYVIGNRLKRQSGIKLDEDLRDD